MKNASKDENLAEEMKDENSAEVKYVRYLCGLALLPEEVIPITANYIYKEWLRLYGGAENLEKVFCDMKIDVSKAELTLLNDDFNYICQESNYNFLEFFDEYYEQQWLKKVGSENFCVYEKEKRTNNACESYHSQLPLYFDKKGSLMDFIRKLLRIKKKNFM